MVEKLDKDRISKLLREADEKWFSKHSSQKYLYLEHIDFLSEYLARNYNKSNGKGKKKQ